MGVAISVTDLSMRYGELVAVDDVSFEVRSGEFFGLLGPNGAGKTTVLEMIEGLRTPMSGSVTVDGIEPRKRDRGLLRRMGVQLQASSFFERLTTREQLDTFRRLYDVDAARVEAMLDHVGLIEKADVRTEDLSGGQKQRLSIACALVHDPEVVFLDEPTAALDPQARRNLWDLLQGLNDSGRTVVLTTHYMDEAEALCDRVGIIDHGQILELDTPQALIRSLGAPVQISLDRDTLAHDMVDAIPAADHVGRDDGALTITTPEPARVLTWLAERDALAGLSVKGATLEDVFLDRTGREYRA